jgi:hypothetical protein
MTLPLPQPQAIESEKRAYAAEIKCLQAKLAKMNGDNECKKVVTDRIKQIKDFVTNPPVD